MTSAITEQMSEMITSFSTLTLSFEMFRGHFSDFQDNSFRWIADCTLKCLEERALICISETSDELCSRIYNRSIFPAHALLVFSLNQSVFLGGHRIQARLLFLETIRLKPGDSLKKCY
ncbi:hypothetical protein EG68_04325 [Paragonimus skrjabini miyazakii]|uniref:Uncharacterized protein n=1 Tax=Paragonimus skrjabini miyazakii TaxID=59628 RepID=A0A8S9YTN7_9TREM|nr:hypothetical protein EG68_04325 [Paragonimus skrjabini miyazakii]